MAAVRTNYEYHVPTDLPGVLKLLEQYGADARIVAGGTDLIPKIKSAIMKFGHLISLKKVEELKNISFDPEKGLTIGANVTLRDTEDSEWVRKYYPALYTGIHTMANTQIRNRGTVTGNICNAVPSADTAPALIIYNAEVHIAGVKGNRVVPVADFFTGVCRTCLQPDEIVTCITIPVPDEGAVSQYTKYTIRKGLELAMVGVASNILLDGNKVVQKAGIALGAVAVVPKHAETAEKMLLGQVLTDELIEKAARAASEEDCAPISDIRATAGYRRRMVYVHTRDALRKAVDEQ